MNLFNEIKSYVKKNNEILNRLENLQDSIGRIESRYSNQIPDKSIQSHEFKVCSQNGEDGIIQFLINSIDIPEKIFVEFGVENYSESNTRFLLKNNNWSGLVLDGSPENIQQIKSNSIYWKYNLKAERAFVDCENINKILEKNGLKGDIGLLSVDVDGNDYWIWNVIDCISPRIVICEYNSLFGYTKKVTIPYDKNFVRSKAHFSNLYYGCSIAALTKVAYSKGYQLVGSNTAGNNAFFVRNDVVGQISIYSTENAYVKAKFRESRDINGQLNYLDFDERLKQIAEMPLFDLDANSLIKVKDLL